MTYENYITEFAKSQERERESKTRAAQLFNFQNLYKPAEKSVNDCNAYYANLKR
jgi:hypothetical protein